MIHSKKNTKIFKHGGWTFRTNRSHILGTEGQYAWKRELHCFQGQSLPDAIFHNNSLEILHDDTGIRIRFCALEALRAWASLELEPVKALDAGSKHWRHQMNITPSVDYDYTYTTLYSGGTDVIDHTMSKDGDNDDFNYLQNDSSSFVAKKVIDNFQKLGGPARLRRPICKCKGDGGRAPFLKSKKNQSEVDGVPSPYNSSAFNSEKKSIATPPQWRGDITRGKVDIESMIRKFPQPLCYEVIDLYEDELHENGTSFLKAKIFVTPIGWAGLLRFFVRVDRVMARVIDTRFIHHFGDNHVLREHSWREGSWKDLLGEQNVTDFSTTVHPTHGGRRLHVTSLESANDSLASRVLRLKEPVTTESLSLEKKSISFFKLYFDQSEVVKETWQIQSHCLLINATSNGIICPTPLSIYSRFGICMISIRKDGTTIDAIKTITHSVNNLLTTTATAATTTRLLWTKSFCSSIDSNVERKMTTFLSLQVSLDTLDGGRLVLGDDRGWGHIWRLSTGESLFDFPIANENVRARCSKLNITSARLWVDNVIWSRCGNIIGAAAGRSAVLVSAQNGQILSSIELMEGSITGIAFRNQSLGITSYGVVRWLTDKDENNVLVPEKIKRAGASIQCIDISPDGTWVALGFLDKTMRVLNTMNHNDGGSDEGDEPLSSECHIQRRLDDMIDWLGFNAPVKLVRFSEKGNWLAAMGGSSILVLPIVGFDSTVDGPTVCRTYGQTTSDGCDGSCMRFLSFVWSSSEENVLFAIDISSTIHIFDVTNTDQAWPKRIFPLSSIIR